MLRDPRTVEIHLENGGMGIKDLSKEFAHYCFCCDSGRQSLLHQRLLYRAPAIGVTIPANIAKTGSLEHELCRGLATSRTQIAISSSQPVYAGSAQAIYNSVQQVHHDGFDRHVITKPCTIIVAVSR
jgi:hypothetical protein